MGKDIARVEVPSPKKIDSLPDFCFFLGGGWGASVCRKATIMDKSLGTLLHVWGVSQFAQAQHLPSPHKQSLTRVSRIFSKFQFCIGWGRENSTKISKRMHFFIREPRNDRKISILHYCRNDFSP